MGKWMGNGWNITQTVNYRLIPSIKWVSVFGKEFGKKTGKFVQNQNWKREVDFTWSIKKMERLLKREFLKRE